MDGFRLGHSDRLVGAQVSHDPKQLNHGLQTKYVRPLTAHCSSDAGDRVCQCPARHVPIQILVDV